MKKSGKKISFFKKSGNNHGTPQEPAITIPGIHLSKEIYKGEIRVNKPSFV